MERWPGVAVRCPAFSDSADHCWLRFGSLVFPSLPLSVPDGCPTSGHDGSISAAAQADTLPNYFQRQIRHVPLRRGWKTVAQDSAEREKDLMRRSSLLRRSCQKSSNGTHPSSLSLSHTHTHTHTTTTTTTTRVRGRLQNTGQSM